MKLQLDLDWHFCANLGDVEDLKREGLQRFLKPKISIWINKTYPELLHQLKKNILVNCSTISEIFSAEVPSRPEPIWLFVALCANRTIKSDCVVVIGATEESVKIWAEGFRRAQEEKNNAFLEKVGKSYEDRSSFVLKNISSDEFHTLYLGPPTMVHLSEVEWLSDVIARVLGVVIHDLYDNDWGFVVLGRDERHVFRAIDLKASIETREQAAEELRGKMVEHLATGAELFPQGD